MLASIEPLTNRTTLEVIGTDRLSDDVVMVRWRSRSKGAVVLRTSVWVRTPQGWKLRFHQGTPADL